MIHFIVGFFTGAFVAQNYDIPNVRNLFQDCLENLKHYEKKETKKK